MKRFLMFFVLASLIFGSVNSFAAAGGKPFSPAEEGITTVRPFIMSGGFTLKDQNDASYTIKFPRDKVTVLIFGDREGSEQIEGWTRPIYNQFGSRIDVYGIAELSAVPSLARGIVRRIIKSKTKYSVLLDWSGGVSKAYGYEKGKANVIVIDKKGNILAKRTGAANQSGLQALYQQINRGL